MSTIAVVVTAVSAVFLAGASAADTRAAELTNDPSGTAVVDLALNQKQVDAAIDKYLAPPYTQHNPMVPDGMEGAPRVARRHQARFRGRRLRERALARHHCTGRPGMAIVNIFRMDNGKIVEHWDVIQPVPEKAANENTMF